MSIKKDTQKDHYKRINRVLQYIRLHLDEELELEKLALIGSYSVFHFHRIMRAYLGESIGAFIIRIRMENSLTLLRFTDLPVKEIAMKMGYDNISSFNRAFKKRFDVSPVEYRKTNELSIKENGFKQKMEAMKHLKSEKPKIKTLKARKLIYVQMRGRYTESASKAWERICEFAKEKKLFGFRTEFIGISHDDPKVTKAEKLRYDACLTITKDVQPEGDIGIQEIHEGKYAIFTHKGPYENLTNSYDYIFGKWIVDNQVELRSKPGYEKYLNSPDNTKPEQLLTEIHVPIV